MDGNVELTDHEHRTACRGSEERNPNGCKVLRGQGPRRGEVDGQVIPMELLQLQLLQLLQKGGISYNPFLKTL